MGLRAQANLVDDVNRLDLAQQKAAKRLTNLGVMRGAARDLAGSRTALGAVREFYRNLPKADADSHEADFATLLLAYSGTLRQLRDLPAASESLQEALSLFRELDQATPNVFRYPFVRSNASQSWQSAPT
jgi:hypothetical protein